MISTIPIDTYSSSAAETVIGIFGLSGLSQLIIGLIYLLAAIRYRALIPFLYVLLTFEYAMLRFRRGIHQEIGRVLTG